jgi:protocatechuate 3,4-dioxygenase, alpha subunit
MYFEPGADPVLDAVPAARRELLVAKKISTGWRFDIRLRGEGETPFFDD